MSDRRPRLFGAGFALLLAFSGLAALSDSSPVLALSCGSFAGAFAGNFATHPDAVRGGKVSIEYFDPTLCTGTFPSFSSYWVGVVGPYVTGRNILQVGVDKCKGTECVSGAPSNQTYKFWAYGREQGSCGFEENPSPHPLGNITGGDLTYKVVREYQSGQAFYNVYISTTGVLLWTYTEASLESCWGSVDEVQYMNEVGNVYDQSGGESGNTQTFQSVYWYDGSGWNRVTGTTGAWCDARDLPSMGCKWHSTNNTLWNSWDTRY